MLTVTLMLSGPHRLAMLETAFSSIPIDSPAVSEVLVRHQGGPWNWGGEVRERILAHPKVRQLEFPDRVDWKQSFNRTLEAVRTPWALMLPDDDFLVRPVAKAAFEQFSARPDLHDCGLVAFGWYYLKDGRYVPNYFPHPSLATLLSHTPKFCSTMLNMQHVRELGGFADMGGYVDAELFGRLICAYDAILAPAHVGVYRMHEGQESTRIHTVYAPFVAAMSDSLSGYARDNVEREAFERELHDFVWPRTPRRIVQMRELLSRLRSRTRPKLEQRVSKMYRWSEG